MKYEADIIKAIVDSRGHEKSSIHYQSECVEQWVKEVEGAYPKLCDYQPEWLNYSNENKIGVFPYTTLTDVTNATVENVVPYAYKSAILTGQTLVNLIIGHQLLSSGNVFITYENGIYTYQSTTEYTGSITPANILTLTTPHKLELNKTFTLFITQLSSNNCRFGIETLSLNDNGSTTTIQRVLESTSHNGEVHKITFTLTSEYDLLRLRLNAYESTERSLQFKNISILEGDWTNVDIPYFTGMQSVKLPVLTTSNEDGTKTNILTVNEDVTLRGIGEVKDELNCLTGEVTERIGEIVLDGSEGVWSKHSGLSTDECDVYWTSNGFIPSVGKKMLSDKLGYSSPTTPNTFRINDSGAIFIGVSKGVNINDYLSQNTPKIQYDLSQSIIKTVDLTVVDQDGNEREQIKPIEGTMHLSTSGETIKPLFNGEIPVEAITQNLASFIEE
nr:MAG TPA: hypothetical protein [Caudoviricetes sp.]